MCEYSSVTILVNYNLVGSTLPRNLLNTKNNYD